MMWYGCYVGMGEDSHWRCELGEKFAVHRRRNQNVKGYCYESEYFRLAIQTTYTTKAQVSLIQNRLG